MAQVPYRANLSAASFPMTIAKAGRSVIIPAADQNFDHRVDPSGDTSVSKASAGIPQVMYMENVLPTNEGFKSVQNLLDVTTIPNAGVYISAVVKVVTKFGSVLQYVTIAFLSDNTAFSSIGSAFAGTWNAVTLPGAFVGPTDPVEISYAVVQGIAYVSIIPSSKLFTVTDVAGVVTLTDVTGTLTGVAGTTNIVAAYNYLISHDLNTVYWSSLTSPVDFVPSLISGAGQTQIGSNESTINFILPHPTGFFVYTRTNVISARFTGNRAYPWRFIPIADSGFVQRKTQVGWNQESQYHFAKLRGGSIVAINTDISTIIIPEVSEYIEKETNYDSFDDATNTFSTTIKNSDSSAVEFRLLLDKYLAISMIQPGGLGIPFKHIIIYDTVLKRLGKLVINHTYLNEEKDYFVLVNANTVGAPDNKVYKIDLQSHSASSAGFFSALVLGKFSIRRSNQICLEEFDVECAGTNVPTVLVIPSSDGKNFGAAVAPTLVGTVNTLSSYKTHVESLMLSLLFKGSFDLTTLDMTFALGGTP